MTTAEATSSPKRLRGNIVSLFILQGANYALPLLVIPYLVRVLGPEYYGRIAFAQAFITYFMVLTDYGFNLSATRAIAQVRDDKQAVSRIASAVMLVKMGIMAAGFVIMLGLVFVVPEWRNDWALYAWVYLMVVGSVLFPVWLFQGLEKMRHITFFTIISRLLLLLAILLFVKETSDYHLAAALQAGSMALAGVMSLAFLPRIISVHWHWPGWKELHHVARNGWHVFLASFGGSIYNNSNVFFLGIVASSTVVGYFAAADKLIKAVQNLIVPVSQAVYPHVANLMKDSQDKAVAFVRKLLFLFLSGSFVTSLSLLVFSAFITDIVFGENFEPTAEIIMALSFMPLLIALNNISGAQVLVQFRLGRLLSASILIPAVFHVCSIYFVADMFGIIGVAVLMMFTELFVLLIRLAGLKHWHPALLKQIVMGGA